MSWTAAVPMIEPAEELIEPLLAVLRATPSVSIRALTEQLGIEQDELDALMHRLLAPASRWPGDRHPRPSWISPPLRHRPADPGGRRHRKDRPPVTEPEPLTVIERAVLAILVGRHHTEQRGRMPDRATALAVHVASGLLGGGTRPDAVYAASRSRADRGLVELTRHGGHLATHVTAAGLEHGVLR